ncbi:MAG: 16S rRNA (uracil(1498)-N(3))-methyltransferase [candidate division NC10 bacterium]|nr:16S rRNA (uracil(1498)-N(3))-methyltransferase [candidate division NC10 bacterium]
MHRFFVPRQSFQGDGVLLSGADARQIRKVLRLKPGDLIEVMDGEGSSFLVRLEEVRSAEVLGRLLSRTKNGQEFALEIILAQALPRLPKMDLIVQKATELGVTQIIPLLTERSLLQGEAAETRIERWRRIAKESAEQCGRRIIPRIESPQKLLPFLEQVVGGERILFWEGEKERRLRQVLRANPEAERYLLLVGPEGGFSPQEVKAAERRGFASVSLGTPILRAESVALVAIALLQYQRGDLG